MTEHFTITESFNAKLDLGKLDPASSPDDRLLVLKVLMKMADNSAALRQFPVARRLSALLFEEFLQQGDEEKELGLPVSEFMDREHTSLDRCRLIFIESFTIPLAQALHRYCPSADEPVLLLVANAERWKSRASKSKMGKYKARITPERLAF